jgi:UDP:flavonoid glycosyltransferase YjiC (YdhE family)
MDGSDGTLSPELIAFLEQGPPPIVFTLGTSAVHNPGHFYGVASRSSEALGLRAVLVCGDHSSSLSLPKCQIAVPFASHCALFPKAAIVAHHGGMGTCGKALHARVPQLLVPHGTDQPDNAGRMTELRVGLVTKSWQVSERAFRQKLFRLQTEHCFRENAHLVYGRLRSQDGAQALAEHLLGAAD